jgi:hypothetical protein
MTAPRLRSHGTTSQPPTRAHRRLPRAGRLPLGAEMPPHRPDISGFPDRTRRDPLRPAQTARIGPRGSVRPIGPRCPSPAPPWKVVRSDTQFDGSAAGVRMHEARRFFEGLNRDSVRVHKAEEDLTPTRTASIAPCAAPRSRQCPNVAERGSSTAGRRRDHESPFRPPIVSLPCGRRLRACPAEACEEGGRLIRQRCVPSSSSSATITASKSCWNRVVLNDYRLKGGRLRARLKVAPRPEVSRRGSRS